MTIEYKDSKRIVVLSTDVANTPTVNDDLITDKGWDTQGHIGMTYDATNDEVDFNCVADTTHDYALIDLQDADYINGSNISDTAFELRCGWRVDTISNASANENRATIGLYANNTSNNTAQDIFTLRFSATTGGGQALEMFAKDNAIAVGGSAEYTFTETLSAQTLYLRFNRDGNNFRIRLYSDSNYTTLVEDSGNQSVSGITGLRYFGIKNRGDTQNNGGSTTGAILPNIEIYDGATTNKPSNVQDNSLLVEKDIGNRFWFSAESENTKTVDENFDSTGLLTWTDSDSAKITVDSSTNERLDFTFVRDSTTDETHHDLGSALSNTAWIMDFDLTLSTVNQGGGTDGNLGYIGIFSATGQGTQDGMHLQIISRSDYTRFRATATYNSSILSEAISEGTAFTTVTPSVTTYYVRIIRDGNDCTVEFYSSADRTGTPTESQTETQASITGLRYISVRNLNFSAGNSTNNNLVGYIDNLKIYDGVTSATIPATWTNEDIFTDDYSSNSGWTSVGSSTTVNSTVAGKVNMTGDIDNWVYKDLGFNLKSKWIARGNIKATSYGTSGRSLVPVTFIDDPTIHVKNGTGNNGIGIFMDTTGGTRYFWLSIITNGFYDRGTNDSNHRISFVVGTTYYYELIRDGSTLTLRITTNSDFSGGSVITRTTTLPSNTFRYLVHGTDVATSGSNTVEADDTVVHNGVTSIN